MTNQEMEIAEAKIRAEIDEHLINARKSAQICMDQLQKTIDSFAEVRAATMKAGLILLSADRENLLSTISDAQKKFEAALANLSAAEAIHKR